MFWSKNEKTDDTRKTPISSAEYDDILKRISAIHAEIGLLKIKFENLQTDILLLRGKFNSKIKSVLKLEEHETEKDLSNQELGIG